MWPFFTPILLIGPVGLAILIACIGVKQFVADMAILPWVRSLGELVARPTVVQGLNSPSRN